jgi:short-subunit dehydrogenase
VTLKNKTVLITGASRGLGRALALAFAEQGSNLLLLARSQIDLLEVAEQARQKNVQVETFVCNLTNTDDIAKTVGVMKNGKAVDVLINSAGMGFYKPFLEHSLEEHDAILDLNVRGLIHLTQGLLPQMLENKAGHIVNIASDVGTTPIANMAVYSASKFAVRGFTISLAKEVRKEGVKVSLINPGIIDTAFNNSEEGSKEPDWSLRPNELAELIVQVVTQPGYQLIDEITVHPIGQDY